MGDGGAKEEGEAGEVAAVAAAAAEPEAAAAATPADGGMLDITYADQWIPLL